MKKVRGGAVGACLCVRVCVLERGGEGGSLVGVVLSGTGKGAGILRVGADVGSHTPQGGCCCGYGADWGLG